MSLPRQPNRMVAIDGRDALYYLIIRPGPNTNEASTGGSDVLFEQGGNGLTQQQAARVLRMVADRIDPTPEEKQ